MDATVDADIAVHVDAIPPLDAGPRDATPPDAAPPEPGPSDYCEASVDFFCDFYLRCGRMAADDVAACRVAFTEVCNLAYEPIYVAHAERGELLFSSAGLAACAAHLAEVVCDAQIYDLDGPCAQIWQGQVEAGGTCAPGIGAFVCGPGTTCVIGLDLCGVCVPTVALGSPCGPDARCAATAECVDARCVARAVPGASCEGVRCVMGASCVEDVCVSPERAVLDGPCDRVVRCPYKSACVDGVCVETGLAGAVCSVERPCAAGWCAGGRCQPLSAPGARCEVGAACPGGYCEDMRCAPPVGACFSANE